MKEKEINELIEKGYIHARVIFEMAGNPKEHVEKTLKDYMKSVKEDPEYIFIAEHSEPCEEKDPGIWSTFIEADILIASFDKLNILCFNLSPASVEIIRPSKIEMSDKTLSYLYNDLISKLHEVSSVVKNFKAESDLLKININRLIRNCITLSLNEHKTGEEIGLKIGIDKEHLQPFLDVMIKEGKIVKNEDKYSLK